MIKEDLETPTVIRRQMYEKMPEKIQELTTLITVKKTAAAMTALKLDKATQQMLETQKYLQELVDEIKQLDGELLEQIKTYAKESL